MLSTGLTKPRQLVIAGTAIIVISIVIGAVVFRGAESSTATLNSESGDK